jgi:hypothetical protein
MESWGCRPSSVKVGGVMEMAMKNEADGKPLELKGKNDFKLELRTEYRP